MLLRSRLRFAHYLPLLAACVVSSLAHASNQCIPAPTDVYAADNSACDPVEITWTSNGGTQFAIMRAPADNPGDAVEIGTSFTNQYIDSSGESGRMYLYWVIAIDTCGSSEPSQGDYGGTGLSGTTPPSWVNASDNQYCNLITIDWDQTYGPYWDLYRSESSDFSSASLVASNAYPPVSDYNVAGNVGYYYWVVANNGCGGGGTPSSPDIGFANFGLFINGNPSDAYAYEGEGASFSISISGFGDFQWYHNGQPLYDGNNIYGAQSSSLYISPVSYADAGNYYCEVYGGCGSQTSNSATLYVESRPCLPPSWISASDNEYCDLIVVDWDTGSGAGSYEVYRSEIPDFSTAASIANTSPPLFDYSVGGNVGYYYWVVAYADCGASPPSQPDVGYSNFGLYITADPVDQTVISGESASFSISISGFGDFDWYRNGQLLSDGGNISGAHTDTLVISPATIDDVGNYYCEVLGGCGSQTSGTAHLYVEDRSCPADFNQDGGVDGSDVEAFFIAWESGDESADVNFDGGIDGSDVEIFMVAWEAGGC